MNIKVFLTLCLCLTCFSFLFSQNLSVSDTIQVRWDTLKQPAQGPAALQYYQYGDSIYCFISSDNYRTVIEKSTNYGADWNTQVIYNNGGIIYANNKAIFLIQTKWTGEYKPFSQYYHIAPTSIAIKRSLDGGHSFTQVHYSEVNVLCPIGGYCGTYGYLETGINDSTIILNTSGFSGAMRYITTDLGNTWQPFNNLKNYSVVNNRALFWGGNSHIYITDNQSMTSFQDSVDLSQLQQKDLASTVIKDSFFTTLAEYYTKDKSIYYTTANRGKTWSIDTLPFIVNSFKQYQDTILVFSTEGIFKTTDIYLKDLKKIYPTHDSILPHHTGFSILKSGWYLNNYRNELLRSQDYGKSWQLVNNKQGIMEMEDLYILGDSILLQTTTSANNKIYFTAKDFNKVDGKKMYLGEGNQIVFKRQNRYFTRNYANNTISYSDNYGQTWKLVTFFNNSKTNNPLKFDSSRIYLGGANVVRISYDNGTTFVRKTINNINNASTIEDLLFIDKVAYCTVYDDNEKSYFLLKSEDECGSWTKMPFTYKPLNNTSPYAKLFNTQNKLFISTDSHIVYESSDSAKTWSQKLHQSNYNNIIERGKHLIYISNENRHLKISADNGISWTHIPYEDYYEYKLSKEYLYAYPGYRFIDPTDNVFPTRYVKRIHLDTLVSRVAALENYGILRGRIFKDSNNNCQQDMSENTGIENKIVHISPRNFMAVTDSKGQFEIALPPDTYTISTDNMPYFTRSCSNDTLHFTLKDKETIDTSLVFKKWATVYDLSLSLSSGSRARPGDEMVFVLKVDNKGTEDIDSAKITLSFPSQYVSWVSANSSMNQQNGILTTQLKNFKVGTSQTYEITLKNATNTPLSTALIFKADGQILNKKDTVLKDNTDSLQLTVVGSFDPNDKTVLPEGPTPANIGELDYLIRFQNTGTDTAFKVVVVDTLPSNLDPLSIKSVVASHAYKLSIKGNILTFTFDKIFLPDSFVNEKASHGFVRFKIRPQKWVYEGSFIFNKAAIYFDYNEPVITNTTLNQLVHPVFFIEQREAICEGESFRGKIYRTNAFVYDTTRSWQEDTIRVTQIIVMPIVKVYKDTVLKATDTFLNKTWADKDKVEVRYKTSNGCDSIVYYTLHLLKTGLNDINSELNFVAIYPNPTRDIISIDYYLIKSTSVRVILYNMIGQKLKILENISRPTEGVHHLSEDVKNLPEGTYQISIETDKGVESKRFVKQ